MLKRGMALALVFVMMVVFFSAVAFADVSRFVLSRSGAQALFNYGDFFTGGNLFGDTQVLVESGVTRIDKDKTPFIVLFFFTHETTCCGTPEIDIIDVNEAIEIPESDLSIKINSASLKADFTVYDFDSQLILPVSIDLSWTRSGGFEIVNENEHFASNGVQTIIRFKSKSAPAMVTGTVTFNSANIATLNNGGSLFDIINGEMTIVK